MMAGAPSPSNCTSSSPGAGAVRDDAAAAVREFSLEGQVRAPGGGLFAPIKFCRQCGQDFYHVLRQNDRFVPHPLGIESADEEAHPAI